MINKATRRMIMYPMDNQFKHLLTVTTQSHALSIPDATPEQIKKTYYNFMKSCHLDLSGNDADTTNFCMFINEVYTVLSDLVQRMVYDEIHGYALTATKPFLDDSYPKDHVLYLTDVVILL
ncbi:hypothetical protein AgCh_021756 [Apium graveolens]